MTLFLTSCLPALVVVDMQERLLKAMHDPENLLDRCFRLVRGAALLKLPVCFFQQNPQGLGSVLSELRALAEEAPLFTKQHFSGHRQGEFRSWLKASGAGDVLICGMETHVCVGQTAMGLASEGFRVHVAMDAVASRRPADKDAGLLRMQAFGVLPASVEGLLFEILGQADVKEFKDFLEIVR